MIPREQSATVNIENKTLVYSNGVRLKMPTHRGIFFLLVRFEDLKLTVPMKRERLVLK